ncbi:hypothetical protein AWM70_00085 [Paenibacillus yonginensis]|uniref:Uncharacterized protein n=1 Tax=Paenibacillus yonginensis TaxID=1462996 RepID=A0A1B1MVH4_9BACL|nr:hypothetical protein [Paenibacillus yonginensis]ANS73178.1 hypothetical protein AWM70_00085 [Paenibacillus yonginensis]
MNRSEIDVDKTYVGKSGLRRRVLRIRINGADSQGYLGDVEYIPIDRKGKEGKPQTCGNWTFAQWAISEEVK